MTVDMAEDIGEEIDAEDRCRTSTPDVSLKDVIPMELNQPMKLNCKLIIGYDLTFSWKFDKNDYYGLIAIVIFAIGYLGFLLFVLLQNSRAAQALSQDIVIDLCKDPSTAADCKNHGSCIMNGTNPVCECEIGFVGWWLLVDDCSNITCYHLKWVFN